MPNKTQLWNKCARIFEDKTNDDIVALLFAHFGCTVMKEFIDNIEPEQKGDNNDGDED